MNLDWQLIESCKLKLPGVSKNTFKFYTAQKDKPKIILSDDSKTLQIYDISAKDPTLQTKSSIQQKNITAVSLSDQLIFFNVGASVKAITRKGKQIFYFQTYMAQTVRNVHVWGFKLWVIGDTLINQFQMGQSNLVNTKSRKGQPPGNQKTDEVAYFMSEDLILDSRIHVQNQIGYCIILRKNNQVQIIDKGQMIGLFKTQSVPNCCANYSLKKDQQSNRYLIGLASGIIICVEIDLKKGKKKQQKQIFTKLWQIQQGSTGKIVSLCSFSKGILVNRSTSIQIWSGGEYQQKKGQLINNFELAWKKQVDQSILEMLYIEANDEIYYVSFTGKVYSLSNYQKQMERDKKQKKQIQYKTAIVTLKKQVERMEAEYKQLKSKQIIRMGNRVQKYKFNYNLNLNPSKFCHNLEISSSIPITTVIFSGSNIKIVTDKQITYQTPQEPLLINKIRQVVIKLQPPQHQTSLQIHSINQQIIGNNNESINVFVTLKGDKQLVNSFVVDLKQLSMYTKIDNTISKQFKNRNDLNRMSVQGKFTKIQFNSWMAIAFQQVQKGINQDFVAVMYQSIITKLKLACQYKDNSANFLSQSISPLIIIKRILLKKAKQKEQSLIIKLQANKISIHKTLKLLQPKFIEYQKIQQTHRMLPGLIELKTQQLNSSNSNQNFFNPQFQQMIDTQQQVKKRFKQIRKPYEDLKNQLLDLYRSYQLATKDNSNTSTIVGKENLSQFQKQNFLKKLNQFNLQQIKSVILS